MTVISDIERLREVYHRTLLAEVLYQKKGWHGVQTISIADSGSRTSTDIAAAWADAIASSAGAASLAEQTAGKNFETATRMFVEHSFSLLNNIRPGSWETADGTAVGTFDQYQHLEEVEYLLATQPQFRTTFGGDYLVKPDIVVYRLPVPAELLGGRGDRAATASLAPLLEGARFAGRPILHASISCKLTMRSDRAQNARTEALNLIRNRKGRLPHIVAVTAEPTPNRLASLALGTGDLDCVYHAGLWELELAVNAVASEDAKEMLAMLVEGRRLRDISDLPLDLAV